MDNIQEIKSRLDIVDVLTGYIRLTPAGSANFKAVCPFHNEKTPSFMVSREKQIWKCFGCGKGGSIFDFIMEMEGVEFKDALRILAGKAGVELKKQDPQIASQRNKILDCLDMASRFFHQVLLNHDIAKGAREYLKNRGIDDMTIDEFKIGFAPDSWDSLYKALRKKGVYANDIEKAGLIIKKQSGNDYYDRFRNRIMFPIRDINGNVSAFSGRILDAPFENSEGSIVRSPKNACLRSQEGEAVESKMRQQQPNIQPAKYINSPQTMVYDKSRMMYAFDKAKMEIKKKDFAVIVEGQMDAIACHKAGYKNVIATSGTALTAEHVKIIKRYTNNIALCFDHDEAGMNAARRAVDIGLESEMNVKIIKITGAKDPDECIKKNPSDWEKAVEGAENFIEYYFQEVFSKFDDSLVDGKKRIAKNLLPLLKKISDKVEQTHYLQKLASGINVGEDILREALGKVKTVSSPGKKKEARTIEKEDKDIKAVERIVALSLIYLENFPFVIKRMQPELISSPKLNFLYKELVIYYTDNAQNLVKLGKFDIEQFVKSINSPGYEKSDLERYLSELWMYGEKEVLDYKEAGESIGSQRIKIELESSISRLKEKRNKKRMIELQMEIRKAEEAGDIGKIESLSREVSRIMGEMRK